MRNKRTHLPAFSCALRFPDFANILLQPRWHLRQRIFLSHVLGSSQEVSGKDWCLISETVNTNIGVEEYDTNFSTVKTNSTPGRSEGQRLDDLRDEPMVPHLPTA